MGEVMRREVYEGTVVQVGNSRGMRLPAKFFHAHPEFSGKVQVTVVADGAVLVSVKLPARGTATGNEADPVVTSFLRFIEAQRVDPPEDIVLAATEQSGVGAP